MRFRNRQSGQAAVETAIVMPLNLFLILSILQYGLISQARYMAKYAAYRAARVGAMNNADTDKMKAAAIAGLLPVLTTPHTIWIANAGDKAAAETILPTNSFGSITKKVLLFKIPAAGANSILPGLPMVDVAICGPVKSDLTSITQTALGGKGSGNQVDFDDPRATLDDKAWTPNTDLEKFLATKLRVQVKLNYVMPIPFANWVISRAYLAMALPDVLRMTTPGDTTSAITSMGKKLYQANAANIYIAPIFESYAMRMQSNFFIKSHPLPASYNAVNCVSWAKPNPDK